MANLGRNVQNITNNTPAPHPIGFDDFLSALMTLKTEEPRASQATAGYQHGILSQFSVPEPTIDEAPAFPTPRSSQFAEEEKRDGKKFRDAAEIGGAQANDVQEEDVKVQQDQDDEASAPVEDEEVPWGPHGLN
ncbi:hypothetical protein J4E86_002651 [Alternaria arbusti]|uniref:uncharacterized protein n=1 Tax=Alternaria arbusti TaxID=232088 RepID=UPI002220D2E2|nr:uncharacterized protein J4E86_002651 [Alternaria arbusti]KAI4958931.1 hypothetical protein J4E86_002651 [Alternaria arbusti]